jgi:hypothetical protein
LVTNLNEIAEKKRRTVIEVLKSMWYTLGEVEISDE